MSAAEKEKHAKVVKPGRSIFRRKSKGPGGDGAEAARTHQAPIRYAWDELGGNPRGREEGRSEYRDGRIPRGGSSR